MAAEVSCSLVRILNARGEEDGSGASKKGLITRDFLGGCCKLGSKELDLDLQVPNGWEKRLDVKSGEISLHRSDSPISSTSTEKDHSHQLQDLNYPPSSSSNALGAGLDLKLVPSRAYQSVCTLEKVKFALERAERESFSNKKRRRDESHSPRPSSSEEAKSENKSATSSDSDEKSDYLEKMFAAGCPGCLLYVLISKASPRCPKCDSVVPFPTMKKPRIDLNSTL